MFIKKSTLKTKKYTAYFDNGRKIHFGAKGYRDFTRIPDKQEALRVRKAYRSRHKHDKIHTAYSAGSLSWWILWGPRQDVAYNTRAFKRRFNLS